jgi:hypothetical protein
MNTVTREELYLIYCGAYYAPMDRGPFETYLNNLKFKVKRMRIDCPEVPPDPESVTKFLVGDTPSYFATNLVNLVVNELNEEGLI